MENFPTLVFTGHVPKALAIQIVLPDIVIVKPDRGEAALVLLGFFLFLRHGISIWSVIPLVIASFLGLVIATLIPNLDAFLCGLARFIVSYFHGIVLVRLEL